jgi:peptide/nickel transport system substrate-binding protein
MRQEDRFLGGEAVAVDGSGHLRGGMRRRSAVCAALAAVALVAAGCGGGSKASSGGGGSSTPTAGKVEYGTNLYGALPPAGTPARGGTISFGQLTGETPTDIFPMTDSANCTQADFEINDAMYLPLYNGPTGAVPKVDYAQSVAEPPSFSDGDRTVTIPLRQGLKWSNGAPVDANDVLFYIALLKAAIKESAANWCQYSVGEFPVNVTSMSAPNSHTVVLHLNKRWNPGFFLNNNLQDTDGGVFPMPSTVWNVDRAGGPHLNWRNPAVAKKIYDYLNKQGTTPATYSTNPLWQDVDGAFKVSNFSVTNGSYDLVPNPSYGLSPKPTFAKLSVETFTSETAALTALRTGAVDIIPLDPSQLGEAAGLRSQGVSVFGAPNFGWNAGVFNFEDKTADFDKVIAQLYVRQALEHLIDEPAMISGIFKGAASPTYGPVPSAPISPYAPPNATHPAYPYNPKAAAALLKAHGWKVVPGGQSTCARPGTGAGECGAGIPKGTPIKFVWASPPDSEAPDLGLLADTVASTAKQTVGIDITPSTKTEAFLSDAYDDSAPNDVKYTNDWGVLAIGALLNDYYPTQDGYDSPGSLDLGDYKDPTAERLIAASVHSGDVHAVERETGYIERDLPGLYLPNPDELYAVKNVSGPPDSWTVLTEGSAFFPQYWYRVK